MFVRFKRPPITARFEKHCSSCRKDYAPPMNRRHCKTCKAVLKLLCPCGKQLSIQGGHVYMHLQSCKNAQAVLNPRGSSADLPSKAQQEEPDLSGDEREEPSEVPVHRPSLVLSLEAPAPVLPPFNTISLMSQPAPSYAAAMPAFDLREASALLSSMRSTAPVVPVPKLAIQPTSLIFRPPGAVSPRSAFAPPRLPPPPADLK